MKKRNKLLIILGILIGIVGIGGISYALWSKTFSQSGTTSIASDCFQISFQEDSGTGIKLENSFPMYDTDGKKLTPYTFSVTNKCSSPVEYQLNLDTTTNTTMPEQYLKVMLNTNEPKILTSYVKTDATLSNGKNGYVLETGTISGNTTNSYNLRVWMDSNVTQNDEGAQNTVFESRISITGKYISKYYEPILNGTDPVLKNNLIPVTIADNGEVKRADERSEWYSYEKKNWANAVILEDESKTYYDGEVIPEGNIEAYFVWIPRYKYKIFNDGNYPDQTEVENRVQIIEVEFENKNTTPSTGDSVNTWLTHPAFTSFESNGMWVGKFETGYKGATSTGAAQVNSNDSGKLQIKPNVYSWRNIQVSNAFTASYNYRREYDSHMMKNTEWGAVAYLQHSKYGSQASVRINNNSAYITGYGAVNEPTCGYTSQNEDCNKYESTALNADGTHTKRYNTSTGVLASTTGNISGVYDMSGGSWEYVMGIMFDENGKPMSGRNSIYNSGFNGTFGCPNCDSDTSGLAELTTGINFPDSKYYDSYSYAENDERYDRRILGDATGEMGPFATKTYGTVTPQNRLIGSWYVDEARFVWHVYPWFRRGSVYDRGSDAGVVAFNRDGGSATGVISFRVVLTP